MTYKCYFCDFELEETQRCACPRCGWLMFLKTENKQLEQEYREDIQKVIRLRSFKKYYGGQYD